MIYTFGELREKEVIHVGDGERLGFVSDVEIDAVTGRIIAIRVPGGYRALGLFGKEPERSIPWENIKKIGDDLIIVERIHRKTEDNQS